MHFRILKMIATSGFLTALSASNSISAGTLPRTPLGELTALLGELKCSLRLPSWFKGPTSKGRGGKGTGKEGRGGKETGKEGRGGKVTGNEERGGRGRGRGGTGTGGMDGMC